MINLSAAMKDANFQLTSSVLLWLGLTAINTFAQFDPIETKQQVYNRINLEREKIGMPSIPINKKLERSAQSWARWMPSRLVHNTNFLKRFNRTGAECLAVGYDPVTNWMNSKPHRQSIMGRRVTAMGLGYRRGKWVWRSFTN